MPRMSRYFRTFKVKEGYKNKKNKSMFFFQDDENY